MNTQQPKCLMDVPPWDNARRILAEAMVRLASERRTSRELPDAAVAVLDRLASPDGALPMLPHIFGRGVPNILMTADVLEVIIAPSWPEVRHQLAVIFRTFGARQPADATQFAAEELLDFISGPRCGMPYLRGVFDFPEQRVEKVEPKEAGAGDPASDAVSVVPPGHAIVPLRLTASMAEVIGRIGWTWDELLVAAGAIAEGQQATLAAPGPEAGEVETGWHFVRFRAGEGWSRWLPARRSGGAWYSAGYRGIADDQVDVGPAISTPLPGAAGATGSASAALTADLMRSIENHIGADERRGDVTRLLAAPAAYLVEALIKVARGGRVLALPVSRPVEQLLQPVDKAA
ncbi:MAG: hypothetical protein EKK53_03030 [Burkholderiales bacterium]|nr:MAG: hypothetical protein EKK53_03030 [Burkholderiales bacterium]